MLRGDKFPDAGGSADHDDRVHDDGDLEADNSRRLAGFTAAQSKLADIEGMGFDSAQVCKFAALAFFKHTGTGISMEHMVDDIGILLAANSVYLCRAQIAELCFFVQQTTR